MRDALGIGIATGAYALSFGAISTAAGLSLLQTSALSVLMFTGASQFALVGVVGAGGGAWADGDRVGRGGRRVGVPALRAVRGSAADRRGPGCDLRRCQVAPMMWAGVLVACASCYVLKLAGLSLPAAVLQDARVQRTVPLVPVALLAALVATQTFSTGHHLVVDVRTAALIVAIGMVLLRAPFLVVVASAAATAALLRLL